MKVKGDYLEEGWEEARESGPVTHRRNSSIVGVKAGAHFPAAGFSDVCCLHNEDDPEGLMGEVGHLKQYAGGVAAIPTLVSPYHTQPNQCTLRG